MRRIVYSVAMSLDGFIAGPAGEFDWIPEEPEFDWDTYLGRFDTVLMGRRAYEAATRTPGASLPKMPAYVVSGTLRAEEHPQVTIVGADLPATIAALRRAPGRDIWLFGGGVLFRALLERDEVDVVEVGLVPVLLGDGIPLLPGLDARRVLRLTDERRYPGGLVLLTYDVRRGAA